MTERAFLRGIRNSLEIFSVRAHAYVLMEQPFSPDCRDAKSQFVGVHEAMRYFGMQATMTNDTAGSDICTKDDLSHCDQQGQFPIWIKTTITLNPIRSKRKRDESETERIREISQYRWSSLPGSVDGRGRAYMDRVRGSVSVTSSRHSRRYSGIHSRRYLRRFLHAMVHLRAQVGAEAVGISSKS